MNNVRRIKFLGVGFIVVLILLFPILLNYFIVVNPKKASDDNAAITPAPSTQISENTVKFRLSGMNNFSSFGVVVLEEIGGKVMVRVNMDGEVKVIGPPQPIYIHKGSCSNLGEMKYPLLLMVSGKSTTTLAIGMSQLRLELPLAISVGRSWAEEKNLISCGDIVM